MRYRCSYKFISLLRLLVILPAAFVCFLCIILYTLSGIIAILLFSFFIPILIFIEIKYIPIIVKKFLYTISRDYIIIESGSIIKKTRTIPRQNIQYASLHTGFIERIFGMAHINLMLGAGTVRIWGLTQSDADKLILKIG